MVLHRAALESAVVARMSIDDMVQRDPRITKLATLLGWSRRETMGCLILDVWPICYDQREHTIVAELIDIAAGRSGFAAAMVESGLAEWTRGNAKVRVRGAKERIEYLDRKKRAGVVGGRKSAESRRKNSSTRQGGAQAPGNPSVPDPVPDSASASVPDSASAPDPDHRHVDAPKVDVGPFPRKPPKRRAAIPPEAREVAERVLARLGEHNGVRYTVSDRHALLIARQLAIGVTELELRAVVAYCAVDLAWKRDERMRQYLRPETLFGPETIAKYLDPARTAYADDIAKNIKPALKLVVEGT